MAIAAGVGGSSAVTLSATSSSIDITSATVAEWVYALATLGATQGSDVTFTGWTKVLEGNSAAGSHYALYRRKKVGGDTTFSISWPTSTKGCIGWQQWTGLDGTSPDELAQFMIHNVSGTTYPTPSITPGGSDRWATAWSYTRSTTPANKAITWTADAALVERLDVNNSAAASAPWTGLQVADSAAAVTAAAHSYTATAIFSESHGGAILLYLLPASVVSGTLAMSLPPLTASAAGSVSASGSVAVTLPGLTASAAGTVTAGGAFTATLPPLSVAVKGTVSAAGACSVVLPSLATSLTGALTVAGPLGATLPPLSVAGVGVVQATGAVVTALPALTVSLQGAVVASGALAVQLPPLNVTLAGAATVAGQTVVLLPALALDLDGTADSGSGLLAVVLPPLAVTAQGVATAAGLLEVVLPALSAGLAGAVTVTGPAGVALPSLTLGVTGAVTARGGLGAALPPLTFSFVGHVAEEASGVLLLTLPALVAALVGVSDATSRGAMSALQRAGPQAAGSAHSGATVSSGGRKVATAAGAIGAGVAMAGQARGGAGMGTQ